MPRFGGLSSSFAKMGAGGRATASDPLAPIAPVLDLVSASDSGSSSTDNITTDTTPDIDITFPGGASAGDNIQMYDNGVALGSAHPLTSPEAIAAAWTNTLGALSEGAHSLQATHESGGHTSRKSNPLSVVIDTTAPTLSAPTASQLAQTTASLSVSTNESIGTLYWVVTTSATPPSKAQVKAGQNDGGTSALASGSQAVVAIGTQSSTASGVTVGTRYAYFMHEDVTGNQANVSASSSWSQADITAPTLSSPSSSSVSFTTATISVSTNEGNGTLYWVVSASATPPTSAQIKAAHDSTGGAGAASGNQAVSGTGSQSANVTGLSSAATYYAYFAHSDAAGNDSSVASVASFTTSTPALSSPASPAVGSTTATISVSADEGNGTLYWVVSTNSTPPSAAQIKTGKDSTGSAATAASSQAISGTGTQNVSVTGLTPTTAYYGYFVQTDASGTNSNVASVASFTTTATATFSLAQTDRGENASNANAYTFSSKNLGSHTTDKEVVVGVYGRAASGTPDPLVSVTIDGATAVEDKSAINTTGVHTYCGLWRATVSSTSGNIVVTFGAGSTMNNCSIDVFELVKRGSGPNTASSVSNATVSLTKISGGASLGVAGANSTTSVDSTTATGLTKDTDTITIEAPYTHSSGHSTGDSAGATTVGLVFTVTGTPFALAAAYAAYGP